MTSRARRLRQNLTDAELRLWRALRRDQLNGLHFRRQHPIGPYTVDFYCPALAIAIELDGGQHAETNIQRRDERRTRWLASKGIRVLRFWNNDVFSNLEGVLLEIVRTAELPELNLTPSRRASRVDLPLSGGGGASLAVEPQSTITEEARSGGSKPTPKTLGSSIVRRARSLAPLPLKGGGLGRGSNTNRSDQENDSNSGAPP